MAIIVKTLHIQNKESVLRAAREKAQFTYKGKPIRITVYFLVEISKSRKVWSNVFQVLKDHDGRPRLIYQTKLPAIVEGKK